MNSRWTAMADWSGPAESRRYWTISRRPGRAGEGLLTRPVYSPPMAVRSVQGDLHALADDRRVGGGLCAIALRGSRLHGTCILQRFATSRTPLDADAPHRLRLADGLSAVVRIVKHALTDCG